MLTGNKLPGLSWEQQQMRARLPDADEREYRRVERLTYLRRCLLRKSQLARDFALILTLHIHLTRVVEIT